MFSLWNLRGTSVLSWKRQVSYQCGNGHSYHLLWAARHLCIPHLRAERWRRESGAISGYPRRASLTLCKSSLLITTLPFVFHFAHFALWIGLHFFVVFRPAFFALWNGLYKEIDIVTFFFAYKAPLIYCVMHTEQGSTYMPREGGIYTLLPAAAYHLALVFDQDLYFSNTMRNPCPSMHIELAIEPRTCIIILLVLFWLLFSAVTYNSCSHILTVVTWLNLNVQLVRLRHVYFTWESLALWICSNFRLTFPFSMIVARINALPQSTYYHTQHPITPQEKARRRAESGESSDIGPGKVTFDDNDHGISLDWGICSPSDRRPLITNQHPQAPFELKVLNYYVYIFNYFI